jgi:hypothetical protein
MDAEMDGRGPTAAGSYFGPRVEIGEVFAYLVTTLLLGAWIVFLGRAADGAADREAILTGGLTLAALALFGLGSFLASGNRRRRRGAGIAFLAATTMAAGAAAFLVQLDFLRNTLQEEAPGVLIAVVAVIVAVSLRAVLPAVITQLGLLVALTGLAGAVLAWFQNLVYPFRVHGGYVLNPVPRPPYPVGLVLAAGIWWLLVALGLGLLGRVEAHHPDADGAGLRRAAIARFWAILVAVIGLADALGRVAA